MGCLVPFESAPIISKDMIQRETWVPMRRDYLVHTLFIQIFLIQTRIGNIKHEKYIKVFSIALHFIFMLLHHTICIVIHFGWIMRLGA